MKVNGVEVHTTAVTHALRPTRFIWWTVFCLMASAKTLHCVQSDDATTRRRDDELNRTIVVYRYCTVLV